MSKVVKALRESLLKDGAFRKFFAKQTPGNRIAPQKTAAMDTKFELRFDVGEVVDGKKTVYLQVNSQAKNDALKKFRQKNGTHANLATAFIEKTPQKTNKKKLSNRCGRKSTTVKGWDGPAVLSLSEIWQFAIVDQLSLNDAGESQRKLVTQSRSFDAGTGRPLIVKKPHGSAMTDRVTAERKWRLQT
jgi:hypothetical protein